MGIKSNEAADRTRKGAIGMPRTAAIRLSYIDNYPPIWNSYWKRIVK